jgi:signal transduction histidine kinase
VQTSAALRTYQKEPTAAEIGEALTVVSDTSRDAITELRETVGLLRESQGLDLSVLAERARAGGLDVSLEISNAEDLPAASAIAAFRIAQEALTNVIRHSSATAVTISVTVGDHVQVSVRDNGDGGEPTPGNGITGMKERALSLGGSLTAGPVGDGFAVEASWRKEGVR